MWNLTAMVGKVSLKEEWSIELQSHTFKTKDSYNLPLKESFYYNIEVTSHSC
jgi:hypothetical protein